MTTSFAALAPTSFDTTEQMVATLSHASALYYNTGTSPMSDAEYDRLYDRLKATDPHHIFFTKIGAPIADAKNKVELPFMVGSLNKVKPAREGDKTILDWLRKRSTYYAANAIQPCYIIMPKWDGCSLVIRYLDGKLHCAYTRGDGEVGGDVSHLLPYIQHRLPRKIDPMKLGHDVWVRGELIMRQKDFDAKWKGSKANPRNMVAGFTNRLDFHPGMLDLHFIVCRLSQTDNDALLTQSPSQQLALLAEQQFHVSDVVTAIRHDYLSEEQNLIRLLESTKSNCEYEIDGLVILEDWHQPLSNEKYPDDSVSFKVNSSVEVAVVDVEYNISKDGLAKPRVRVVPVMLSGAMVTYATGFNAKFIVDNGIGPGAIIKLTRSGEVIPDIVGVVESAPPLLPENWEETLEWSPSGVDLVLKPGITHAQQDLKRLVHFCNTLGWEGWKEGVLAKVLTANPDMTPVGLCLLDAAWLKANLAGIKETMANKLITARNNALAAVNLPSLVDASSIFGRNFGTTRSTALLAAYPDWSALSQTMSRLVNNAECTLNFTPEDCSDPETSGVYSTTQDYGYDMIAVARAVEILPGFSTIMATQFARSLPQWLAFHAEISPYITLSQAKQPSSDKLAGHVICMSGFRDKELGAAIVDAGGSCADSLTSKVTVLIVKDPNGSSDKITTAKARGLPVVSKESFIADYL